MAEEQRVARYDFDGAKLENERVILEGIPGGGEHSSRTLKRGPDGFLYVSIGSSCNSCIEEPAWRAAMLRFKEGAAPEQFAAGMRNTVGFDWAPGTGTLFGVDNGRDNLGDDFPDDEVNRIAAGQHYGWPYVQGAEVEDPGIYTIKPPGLTPIPQFHGPGAHVAPLSIRFLRNQADSALNGSTLVTEHGSWNRSEKAGYRIIRLAFEGNSAREEVFLSGCEVNGEVICRPVDILEAPMQQLWSIVSPLLADPVRGVRIRAAQLLATVPTGQLPQADRGAFGKAAQEFIAAQRTNADRPEARSALGTFFLARGQAAEAEAEFNAALKMDAQYSPAVINLSDLYRLLGRDGDSECALLQALLTSPADAALHHARGLALVQLKRLDEALTELKAAAELEPERARYGYGYAVALRSVGRLSDALLVLQ